MQTLSDTHAREQSETLLSDREVSAHTNINTALLAQISSLQQELERTKAENVHISKHKWLNGLLLPSLSILRLVQLKDEIKNIRTSLIPKLNSIQTSQQQAAADIASISQSQFQQEDTCLLVSPSFWTSGCATQLCS